uniref:Uncharacterized protein n=1 Tax=Odontella aurita TaxID=265563 RepID=A0A7S4JNC4_9STRA|mmetsp:Transcript_49964/g.150257  ORF Transcript_49964/g.150257 Transcript_49964/m.150257 type:complete len:455 (+) Transcript_49964:219-1583(+)
MMETDWNENSTRNTLGAKLASVISAHDTNWIIASRRNEYTTRKIIIGAALGLVGLVFLLLGNPDKLTSRSALLSMELRSGVRNKLAIDIISIGSQTRPEYQQAQARTFATHETVRHFFPITEGDDRDASCHKGLTNEDAVNIALECRKGSYEGWSYPEATKSSGQSKHRLKLLDSLRTQNIYKDPESLQADDHAADWMCAQKRPVDGFGTLLDYYKGTNVELPDFLFVVDDDTFINMELVTDFLRKKKYRPSTARVMAGCLMRFPVVGNFPWGGMGILISRAALENFIRPVHCESKKSMDKFDKRVCRQLSEDLIGEKELFREGMSISSLLRAYVAHEKYTSYRDWTLGFCFHNDWLWGYFVDYYELSIDMSPNGAFEDRIGSYGDSVIVWESPESVTETGQCMYKRHATNESHIGHLVGPDKMYELFWSQKLLAPEHFRDYERTNNKLGRLGR